jgi:uncharacterized membrane protein
MENTLKKQLILLAIIPGLLLTTAGNTEPLTSYRIINVAADDPEGLNVRDNVIEAQSLKSSTIIGNLAWNATGIISSGLEVEIGGSVWREIRLGETKGWVNAKYLEEESNNGKPELTPDMLACGGTEPFWSLNLAGTPSTYSGENWTNEEWVENVKLQNMAANPIIEQGDGHWVMTLKRPSAEQYIHVLVARASPLCNDSMSNLSYPYEVILLKGKIPKPVYGCCQIDIDR